MKRLLKVTLSDSNSRDEILRFAKQLTQSETEAFRRIYIKKDLNPFVRKELSRLQEVTKRERVKPENAGKHVLLDGRTKKVLVDRVEVDGFKKHLF